MSAKVFFLTTRGLETVCSSEIATLQELAIESIGYRRISASCRGSLARLGNLQTIDDAFLELANWPNIGRHRQTLALLGHLSSQLDLCDAKAKCASLRPIPRSPAFSISVSFVGRRNYRTAEIKRALSESVMTNHEWRYTDDDDAADLNIRVFIEHEIAYVGLRLSRRPLHERDYKKAHHAGSLKPPVAAAMVRLVGFTRGQRLLDPCCGAGTILVEAGRLGAMVQGGDIDPNAISAARMNMKAAIVPAHLQKWDARALPIPDGFIDYIVSNLPWGRQVTIEGGLSLFYRNICAEMSRILTPSGRIALLTNAPQLVEFQDLHCSKKLEISLFGQTPSILIFTR